MVKHIKTFCERRLYKYFVCVVDSLLRYKKASTALVVPGNSIFSGRFEKIAQNFIMRRLRQFYMLLTFSYLKIGVINYKAHLKADSSFHCKALAVPGAQQFHADAHMAVKEMLFVISGFTTGLYSAKIMG